MKRWTKRKQLLPMQQMIRKDLGQVENILTGKTGTLTENKMILKRCCIAGTFYGNESGDALKEHISKGEILLYKSLSQDEEALVQAAAQLNMVLDNRNANMLGQQIRVYTEAVELQDFTSLLSLLSLSFLFYMRIEIIHFLCLHHNLSISSSLSSLHPFSDYQKLFTSISSVAIESCELIGKTPMVYLNNIVEGSAANIAAKLETT